MADDTKKVGLGLSIHVSEKYSMVTGHFTSHELSLVKQAPGKTRWKDKTLFFERTEDNDEYFQRVFPAAKRTNNDLAEEMFEQEKVRPSTSKFRFKTKPYKHQLETFEACKDEENWALLLEMGLGKTKILIDNMAWLWSQGKITGVVIITINDVHRQWVDQQILTHLPDWVPREAWAWSSRKLPETLFQEGQLKILSMNIEAVRTPKGSAAIERFTSAHHCMGIVDESTRIKNPKAKQTKAVLDARSQFDYRRIATGSPVTKGLENLYSQFAFLDPEIFGFSSFYSFRNFFCRMISIPGAPRGAVKIVGYKNEDVLEKKLKRASTIIMKEDCLDLPAKIHVEREVSLTDEQKRIYKELAEDFYTEFADGIVEAPLAITRLMRMQQVLCGFLPNEEGEILPVKSNRIKAVADILEEVSGKVIIWSRFQHTIEALHKEFGGVTYYGKMSDDECKNAIHNFVEGDERLFIATPAKGGVGLNLAVAQTVIYFSNDFNAETRWQSEDRTHRIGMKGAVTYIDLVAPGTIDTQIASSLRQKKSIAEIVMNIKP